MTVIRRIVWLNKGVAERQILTCIKRHYRGRNLDIREYSSQSDDLNRRRRVVCSGIGDKNR